MLSHRGQGNQVQECWNESAVVRDAAAASLGDESGCHICCQTQLPNGTRWHVLSGVFQTFRRAIGAPADLSVLLIVSGPCKLMDGQIFLLVQEQRQVPAAPQHQLRQGRTGLDLQQVLHIISLQLP